MTTDEREPTFIGLSGIGNSDRPFSQRRVEPARDDLLDADITPDDMYTSWDAFPPADDGGRLDDLERRLEAVEAWIAEETRARQLSGGER